MTRALLTSPFFWIGTLTSAIALAVGCSSSPAAPSGCTSGQTTPCTCPGGQHGTQACGAAACTCGSSEDAGETSEDADVPGDATHKDEQPAPSTTYGVCALPGSFGWPCDAATSGADPAECTDPLFSICFVGAQGGRCTAECSEAGVSSCPMESDGGPDAGCVPTDCNARGYCK